jgi:hypothetical protein
LLKGSPSARPKTSCPALEQGVTTMIVWNSSIRTSLAVRPLLPRTTAVLALGALACALGCSADHEPEDTTPEAPSATTSDSLSAMIGADGGELVGLAGTPLDGVRLTIPAGALAEKTKITIRAVDEKTALPETAVRCGPNFSIEPAGLPLATAASLTLPFDESTITDNYRFDDEVKVWDLQSGKWGQRLQTDSSEGSVTIELEALSEDVAAGVNPPAPGDLVSFDFAPNPKFLPCLAQYPDDPARPPSVHAIVVRGDLNDGLFLYGNYVKPGLKFDMFTVENGSLGSDGKPLADFSNFGLAWYQSDLEADKRGNMRVSIRTILLDQIFGFDPNVSLGPTGTFEVGFWFNNPDDAVACGFDASKPTPFNGEHKAGPLAMITLPDATTGLGPLCTHADTSVSPARCDP